jgi:hypothetical protein
MSGKKILVIVIIAVLISSVVAGAVSFFKTSSTNPNKDNNNALLNARLNEVVNFCIRSLPNGTSVCDNQLLPIVNKICAEDDAKRVIDACSDGKVAQYYKTRNIEGSKSGTMYRNNTGLASNEGFFLLF